MTQKKLLIPIIFVLFVSSVYALSWQTPYNKFDSRYVLITNFALTIGNSTIIRTDNTTWITTNQRYGLNASTSDSTITFIRANQAYGINTSNTEWIADSIGNDSIVRASNTSWVTSNQIYGVNITSTAWLYATQAYGANMTQVTAANTSMKDYTDKTFIKNSTSANLVTLNVTSRLNVPTDKKECFDNYCIYRNSTLGCLVIE